VPGPAAMDIAATEPSLGWSGRRNRPRQRQGMTQKTSSTYAASCPGVEVVPWHRSTRGPDSWRETKSCLDPIALAGDGGLATPPRRNFKVSALSAEATFHQKVSVPGRSGGTEAGFVDWRGSPGLTAATRRATGGSGEPRSTGVGRPGQVAVVGVRRGVERPGDRQVGNPTGDCAERVGRARRSNRRNCHIRSGER